MDGKSKTENAIISFSWILGKDHHYPILGVLGPSQGKARVQWQQTKTNEGVGEVLGEAWEWWKGTSVGSLLIPWLLVLGWVEVSPGPVQQKEALPAGRPGTSPGEIAQCVHPWSLHWSWSGCQYTSQSGLSYHFGLSWHFRRLRVRGWCPWWKQRGENLL